MAHAQHTVTITLPDGTPASHTAEALRYWMEADGAVIVEAACCGMVGGLITCPTCSGSGCPSCGGTGKVKQEDTRSRHSFYDIARQVADPAGSGTAVFIDPAKEVMDHVRRVAEHHAGIHRARSVILDALMKPDQRGLEES
jgi:hypothetical protein